MKDSTDPGHNGHDRLSRPTWACLVATLGLVACAPAPTKASPDAWADSAGSGGWPGTGGSQGTGGMSGAGGTSGLGDAAAADGGDARPTVADARLDTADADSGGDARAGGQGGAIADGPTDAFDAPMPADTPADGQAGHDGPRPIVALPAACPTTIAKGGTDLLIDDLSSGNAQIALTEGRNGLWQTFTDTSGGTLWPTPGGSFEVERGSGPRGGYAARMVGSGFAAWGAGMHVAFSQSTSGPCPYDVSAFSGISFWAKAATPLVARLQIVTTDTRDQKYGGTCTANCENHFGFLFAVAKVWQKHVIAFSDLVPRAAAGDGQAAAFAPSKVLLVELQIPAKTTFDLAVTDLTFTPAGMFGAHPTELCPDIAFDPTAMPPLPHPGGVTFTIDAADAQKKHAISPLIYGSNWHPWWPHGGLSEQVRRFGHTVLRVVPGSHISSYNWELNSSRETMRSQSYPMDHPPLSGQLVRDGVEAARATSATLLVGLSLLDHVAGDPSVGTVAADDPQLMTKLYRQNRPSKGAPFALVPDTSDGIVYQDEYVNWVMRTVPTDVPVIFQLDNEPDYWDVSHPLVHPGHVSYDEYVTRAIALAKAVKTVAPTTEIVALATGNPWGPESLSGWGADKQASAADLAKGPFLEYFLAKVKAEEATFGHRLVDHVSTHYYTRANVGSGTSSDPYAQILRADLFPFYSNQDPRVLAIRLQAPRSLWDPTFTELTSYSQVMPTEGRTLAFIPNLKARIAAAAPGVKLAMTEWNFGGDNHISGAIAVADTLGIMGREGLDMATHFVLTAWEGYAWGAMQVFRAHSATGGQFGDISLSAVSSDPAAASVYASTDSRDPNRMVLVAINKTSDPITASFAITGAPAFATADVFVLGEGATYVKGAGSIVIGKASAWSYTMPRFSVSVLVPKLVGANREPAPFPPDCVRTGNLALSSDFEENADGWMAWLGQTKALSTAEAHTGTHSLHVSKRTETWHGPRYELAMPDTIVGFAGTVRNGYRYDVSGWAKIAGADSAPVNWVFDLADDSGEHFTAGATQVASASGWVEVRISFTPSITGTLKSTGISLAGPPPGVDIFLDDVTITAAKL